MIKSILIISSCVFFLLPGVTNGQMFGDLEDKKDINDSKFFITINTGVGASVIGYSATIPDTSGFGLADMDVGKNLFGIYVPITLTGLYNAGPVLIGAGTTIQNIFSNDPDTGPENFNLLRVFGRFEYASPKAAQNWQLFSFQIGSGYPINSIGEDFSPLLSIMIGYAFVFRVSEGSSFFLETNLGYDTYGLNIVEQDTRINFFNAGVDVGFRFGVGKK